MNGGIKRYIVYLLERKRELLVRLTCFRQVALLSSSRQSEVREKDKDLRFSVRVLCRERKTTIFLAMAGISAIEYSLKFESDGADSPDCDLQIRLRPRQLADSYSRCHVIHVIRQVIKGTGKRTLVLSRVASLPRRMRLIAHARHVIEILAVQSKESSAT